MSKKSPGCNKRQRVIARAMAWWHETGGRIKDPGGGLAHLCNRPQRISDREFALAYACAALLKEQVEKARP